MTKVTNYQLGEYSRAGFPILYGNQMSEEKAREAAKDPRWNQNLIKVFRITVEEV